MKQVIRKSIAVVLLFSVAGFLFFAIGGKQVSGLFQRNSLVSVIKTAPYSTWSADPDTLALLKRVSNALLSRISATGEVSEAAHRTLLSIMSGTAENLKTLAQFITSENGDISSESALLQANAFWKYSLKYNVPLDLIVAVAYTESHFRPDARSPAGASGVMQVMWNVHAGLLQANGILKEEDLHDPDMGIAAGSLLISRYLKAYGDTRVALGRYYGGAASVYWGRVSHNLSKVRNANLMASF